MARSERCGGSLTTAISILRTALDDRDWTIIVAVRGEGYQVGVSVSVRPSPEQTGLLRAHDRRAGAQPAARPVNEWDFKLRPYFNETPFPGLNLADWMAARGEQATLPVAQRIDLVS